MEQRKQSTDEVNWLFTFLDKEAMVFEEETAQVSSKFSKQNPGISFLCSFGFPSFSYKSTESPFVSPIVAFNTEKPYSTIWVSHLQA
jgi:hypothetical protein